MSAEDARQVVYIFEGLVCALAEVLRQLREVRGFLMGGRGAYRRRRVRGITQEHDTSLVPRIQFGAVIQAILFGRTEWKSSSAVDIAKVVSNLLSQISPRFRLAWIHRIPIVRLGSSLLSLLRVDLLHAMTLALLLREG